MYLFYFVFYLFMHLFIFLFRENNQEDWSDPVFVCDCVCVRYPVPGLQLSSQPMDGAR